MYKSGVHFGHINIYELRHMGDSWKQDDIPMGSCNVRAYSHHPFGINAPLSGSQIVELQSLKISKQINKDALQVDRHMILTPFQKIKIQQVVMLSLSTG